ncbi:hypothetical protein EDD17DRAFT_1671345 [Pisolithus thermaeus]|nr:hypothetical protein EDD17DRAFT_1671345 [Pisolithus thermaeus]
MTTLQTYVYYMHFSGDTSTIKFFVGATWILDTVHVVFMCHMLYYYLITNYGVPTSLEHDVWSFPVRIAIFPPGTDLECSLLLGVPSR